MSDYDTQDAQQPNDWFSRIGGVLGGPRDDTVAPIIGQEGLQNARDNALLNFGIGMLNAAGWHPHKVTLGQAFAEGAQGAQQAYQGSLDNSIRSSMAAQQLQLGRLNMQRQLSLMGAAAPILARLRTAMSGGATPGAQADTTPNPFAQGAATPGVQTSPVSMGTPGAAPLPAAGGGAGAAAAPSPMSAPVSMAPAASSPSQRAQLVGALRDYQMLGGLLDPGNAKGVAAALGPSLPDLKQMDDGTIVDLHDLGNVNAFHGKLLDGNAVLGPDGQTVVLRPGVANAKGALKYAEDMAAAYSKPFNKPTYDINGNPQPAQSQGAIINGPNPYAAPQAGTAAPLPTLPGAGAAASPDAVNLPPLPPGMPGGGGLPAPQLTPGGGASYLAQPPGVKAGADGLAKENVDKYSTLTSLAADSADRVTTLDSMAKLANGGTAFGPGTSGRLELLAEINKRLPPGLAFGNDDVANAQVLQKYVSNLSQQYQRALGGKGTDAQLANVLKGTPGPDMLNKAINEVVPVLKRQELALQAKANGADAWVAQHNNNPATLNQYENLWRRNYDPRVYQMQMMEPGARKQFLQQQPDAAALRAKAQAAYQNGWIQ